MGTLNLAGRRPQVVSSMGNGIVWLAIALVILFIGVVILGFRTRLKKKEQMAQVSVSETVAHDSAQSNRTAVRNRADGTPLSAVTGNTGSNNAPQGDGLLKTATTAMTDAVKTDAHPFPHSPISPGAPQPYYYVPPQPQYYAQPPTAMDDPAQRARNRAMERREQAINAPTGINANSSVAGLPKTVDPIQSDLDRIAQLSGSGNSIPQPMVSGSYTPVGGAAMVSKEHDLNQQNGKRKFQQEEEGDYLKTTRVPPISRWVVERGDKIVAILPTNVVSDLPGDLIAEVKDDVYDSPTHKFILIPAGALLAGEYNSSVSYGQGRVQVIWTYLRFPDGSFINLDKFVSHAADGAVGLKDQTDNHIKRMVGGVLLSSIFAAGIQISQNHSGTNSTLAYPSTSQIAASAVGQQAAQLGEQITSRNLNVQPTLKIRPGEPFYVSVQKSMVFSGPYEPMKIGGEQ
jgi:type IV secretion system protein VirB10